MSDEKKPYARGGSADVSLRVPGVDCITVTSDDLRAREGVRIPNDEIQAFRGTSTADYRVFHIDSNGTLSIGGEGNPRTPEATSRNPSDSSEVSDGGDACLRDGAGDHPKTPEILVEHPKNTDRSMETSEPGDHPRSGNDKPATGGELAGMSNILQGIIESHEGAEAWDKVEADWTIAQAKRCLELLRRYRRRPDNPTPSCTCRDPGNAHVRTCPAAALQNAVLFPRPEYMHRCEHVAPRRCTLGEGHDGPHSWQHPDRAEPEQRPTDDCEHAAVYVEEYALADRVVRWCAECGSMQEDGEWARCARAALHQLPVAFLRTETAASPEPRDYFRGHREGWNAAVEACAQVCVTVADELDTAGARDVVVRTARDMAETIRDRVPDEKAEDK